MRRSVTLISVAITAFSVVVLASVVYGLRAAASSRPAPVAAVSGALEVGLSPELAAASGFVSPRISPQAAVTVASELLGRTDAYSIQLTDYQGQPAYKVIFSSGDVVFVSVAGQVLEVIPATVQIASVKKDKEREDTRGGGSRGDDHEESEHEHEDEHESDSGGGD
jgi:hypothetical protein